MNFRSSLDLPDSALRWLEDVFAERFGHGWSLTRSPDGIRLQLIGADRYVAFSPNLARLAPSSLPRPCLLWEGDREGWDLATPGPLPAPGCAFLCQPLISFSPEGCSVAYDLPRLFYFMLTREEEVGAADLDAHGRFPSTSSLAVAQGFIERPLVDEWMHVLAQVVHRIWPALSLRQHHFTVSVSHDVDRVSPYAFRPWREITRSIGGALIGRSKAPSVWRAPWIKLTRGKGLHSQDPFNTFNWLMDVSERYCLTSAFYFICGRTSPVFDADYEPEHPAIRKLMRGIHDRGHEIGLHPSYGSYQLPTVINFEARRLQRIADAERISQHKWGGRMHYLRWDHPATMNALDHARIDYDSTLGFADRAGFRCGTCFEYPAFDPVTHRKLNLRLRPLVAMECTVMAARYMGLGRGEVALEKFLELKRVCRAVRGCFSLLWHNTELLTGQDRVLYQKIISTQS
jgi:hypothetical protein